MRARRLRCCAHMQFASRPSCLQEGLLQASQAFSGHVQKLATPSTIEACSCRMQHNCMQGTAGSQSDVHA